MGGEARNKESGHGSLSPCAAQSAASGRGVPAGDRPRVLFACSSAQWPISSLLKADVFAKRLTAELSVLHVSEAPKPGLFGRVPPKEVCRAIERWAHDSTATLERCRYILQGEVPLENILVRQGDFVQQVVEEISQRRPELVVIPPDRDESGILAADIASSARVPVLIARPPRRQNIVLAATKLADERFPVIRRAGRLREVLDAQLVLVHNRVPILAAGGIENGHAASWLRSEREEELTCEQLATVARLFPHCSGSYVKRRLNTSSAILEVARECDADLIVVGVRRCSSLIERVLGGCMAARVATRALRSVLVTPLPADRAAA